MSTIYISIGNSDDKLTQREWAAFHERVELAIERYVKAIHGAWTSLPISQWQNACWCIELRDAAHEEGLKKVLRRLAEEFRQDSIAWAEATTEFLTPRAVAGSGGPDGSQP